MHKTFLRNVNIQIIDMGYPQNLPPENAALTKMPPRWGLGVYSAWVLPKCRPDGAGRIGRQRRCYQNVAPMGLGVSVGNVDPTKNAAPMGLNVLVGRGVRAFLSPSGAKVW